MKDVTRSAVAMTSRFDSLALQWIFFTARVDINTFFQSEAKHYWSMYILSWHQLRGYLQRIKLEKEYSNIGTRLNLAAPTQQARVHRMGIVACFYRTWTAKAVSKTKTTRYSQVFYRIYFLQVWESFTCVPQVSITLRPMSSEN